jgi:hypothetical protein
VLHAETVPLYGPGNHVLVLLSIDAARGVENLPAGRGSQEGDGVGDNLALDGGEPLELRVAGAVLGLGTSCEDAGVAAGDIQEDQIGAPRELPKR